MTFIKLTDPQDKETVVNFDMVCEMRPTQGAAAVVLQRWVRFVLACIWAGIKWLVPTVVVILAIGFGVEWGGLYHREFEYIKGLTSWTVIWVAIDFYCWAKARR